MFLQGLFNHLFANPFSLFTAPQILRCSSPSQQFPNISNLQPGAPYPLTAIAKKGSSHQRCGKPVMGIVTFFLPRLSNGQKLIRRVCREKQKYWNSRAGDRPAGRRHHLFYRHYKPSARPRNGFSAGSTQPTGCECFRSPGTGRFFCASLQSEPHPGSPLRSRRRRHSRRFGHDRGSIHPARPAVSTGGSAGGRDCFPGMGWRHDPCGTIRYPASLRRGC